MTLQVVLLSKRDKFSREAQSTARESFPEIEIFEGAVGDPEPDLLEAGSPDLLISFLSPWIVRKATLDRCGTAINFHPGSTDYPGTGCYNFALYDEAPEYGAVCHHMLPKVDTGPVVVERRFPVTPKDSVETLKLATMGTMLGMFREILGLAARGEPLPRAACHWTRRPYTRREMEALKRLSHDMPPEEVSRRVRATVYPGYPGPVMRLARGGEHRFPVPDRAALA